MELWEVKAHELIAEMCLASYRQARGKSKSKKHIPYAVPYNAQRLVEALGKEDNEEEIKGILLYLNAIPDAKKDQ